MPHKTTCFFDTLDCHTRFLLSCRSFCRMFARAVGTQRRITKFRMLVTLCAARRADHMATAVSFTKAKLLTTVAAEQTTDSNIDRNFLVCSFCIIWSQGRTEHENHCQLVPLAIHFVARYLTDLTFCDLKASRILSSSHAQQGLS